MSVSSHYNKFRTRRNDDMLGVRGAHNFAKDCLIRRCDVARVLDVCSGNGGDVGKFYRVGCRSYIGVDIAEEAVARAVDRMSSFNDFECDSFVLDVGSDDFSSYITAVSASRQFTTVSCQFAIHYLFDTESRAEHMVSCLARAVAPGGKIIGSTTDCSQLFKRRELLGRKYGDRFFKVAFSEGITSASEFGERYVFSLKGAVDGLEEYVVHKETLVRLMEKYGLKLSLWENMYTYVEREKNDNPGRFSIFNGELHDVTRLYVVFEFSR